MDYLLGLLIAILIAISGVGAGVLIAPLLILFLRIPVEVAVSTALAYSAIVKLIVVPFQVIRRQVNYRVLGVMLLGGIPGVVLGSLAFRHVAGHGPMGALYFALGAIIVFTSGWHLYRHFRPLGIHRPPADGTSPARHPKLLAAIMFPIGAEVGFSSSGAGALGTVTLLGLTSLSAAEVVGTDLAFGLAIALTGSGVHLFGGHYAGPLLLRLAIGGVVGGILGTAIAPKIPNRALRFVISLVLMGIGLEFCYRAITY